MSGSVPPIYNNDNLIRSQNSNKSKTSTTKKNGHSTSQNHKRLIETPYKCTRCPKKFTKQKNFIQHERRIHYQTRKEISKNISKNQKKSKPKMLRSSRKMSLRGPSLSIVKSMYNLRRSLKA